MRKSIAFNIFALALLCMFCGACAQAELNQPTSLWEISTSIMRRDWRLINNSGVSTEEKRALTNGLRDDLEALHTLFSPPSEITVSNATTTNTFSNDSAAAPRAIKVTTFGPRYPFLTQPGPGSTDFWHREGDVDAVNVVGTASPTGVLTHHGHWFISDTGDFTYRQWGEVGVRYTAPLSGRVNVEANITLLKARVTGESDELIFSSLHLTRVELAVIVRWTTVIKRIKIIDLAYDGGLRGLNNIIPPLKHFRTEGTTMLFTTCWGDVPAGAQPDFYVGYEITTSSDTLNWEVSFTQDYSLRVNSIIITQFSDLHGCPAV